MEGTQRRGRITTPVDGLDARIALTLIGPGGGTWWIDEAGVLPSDGKGGRAHHRTCADVCLNVRDVDPVVTRLSLSSLV